MLSQMVTDHSVLMGDLKPGGLGLSEAETVFELRLVTTYDVKADPRQDPGE